MMKGSAAGYRSSLGDSAYSKMGRKREGILTYFRVPIFDKSSEVSILRKYMYLFTLVIVTYMGLYWTRRTRILLQKELLTEQKASLHKSIQVNDYLKEVGLTRTQQQLNSVQVGEDSLQNVQGSTLADALGPSQTQGQDGQSTRIIGHSYGITKDVDVYDLEIQTDQGVEKLQEVYHGTPPTEYDPYDTTPKIALMFLVTSSIPHEPTWRSFLTAAASLTPKGQVPIKPDIPLSDIIPRRHKELQRMPPMHATKSPKHQVPNNTVASNQLAQWFSDETIKYFAINDAQRIYQDQNLFTAYVHLPEGRYLPKESIFSGREIDTRILTQYAQHSLVEAAIELIRAAYSHPLNQKFLLLSEACVPMYPPETVYTQLLYEEKSRINACNTSQWYRNSIYRWRNLFYSQNITKANWRKSSQWFGLDRTLAKVILSDSHVERRFRQYCYTDGRYYSCVPDEHYVPTLLSTYKLENQTDCSGKLTFAYFRGHLWSPVSFKRQHVSKSLVTKIRTCKYLCQGPDASPDCPIEEAIDSSRRLFTYQQYKPIVNQTLLDEAKQVATRRRALLRSSQQGSGQSSYNGGDSVRRRLQGLNHHRHIASAALEDDNVNDSYSAGGEASLIQYSVVHDVSNDLQFEPKKDREAALDAYETQKEEYYKDFVPLNHACPLFGRKFMPESAGKILDVLLTCDVASLSEQCYKNYYQPQDVQ